MTDELVEKVARAIYETLEGPIADQDFLRQKRQWELAQKLARAALAIAVPAVREECAVAADTVSAINQQAAAACPHVGSASIYVARAQGADETSAAIREGNANG